MSKFLKLLLPLFYFTIAGCSEPLPESLRIGTNTWPGYEPLYLARELNYLDKNKIRLIEYTSTSQVLKAYKNGLLDAAALTLDEAITLLDQGEQPRIVLVMDISNGGDVILGQASVKNMADIKGKRIGVEHTALGAYFLSRAIEVSHINKSDITIVPVEAHQHERFFTDKKIDALVTFDPVRSILLSQGANKLFDSSQIPGEIVDVLVVRSSKLPAFKKQIEHLKNSWFQALKTMNDQPAKSAEIMSKRLKISSEEVLKAYDEMLFPGREENETLLYALPEPNLLISSRKLCESMHENKLIKSVTQTENLFLLK